jgi:hypothetical protein
LIAEAAAACPSCGSGGGDPLTLCPFETWKLYVGYARQTEIEPVTPGGEVVENYGVLRKDTLTIAAGGKVSSLSYVTLAAPHVSNERQGRSRSGMGDLSLAARVPFVLQNFAEPLVPQAQFVIGYKLANGRSVNEARDAEYLDVFGTGYPEAKVGLDLWWGMAALRGGLAYTFVRPFEQTYHGVRQRPGDSTQAIVSLGSEAGPFVGVTGLMLQSAGERTADGGSVEGSEIRSRSVYAMISYKHTLLESVVFSATSAGVGGGNRNTTRATTFTLALTKAWI